MNYSQIVETSIDYLARNRDAHVLSRIDSFLRIVESRVNRVLEARKQTRRATMSTRRNREFHPLPADFSGLRSIIYRGTLKDNVARLSDTRVQIEYVTPSVMNEIITEKRSDVFVYTIEGRQLHIYPTTNSGLIEIMYYQNVPALLDEDGERSNWLSNTHPDLYIFGLCVEIASFTLNQEAAAFWDTRFKSALEEINTEASEDTWSGTPLVMRIK